MIRNFIGLQNLSNRRKKKMPFEFKKHFLCSIEKMDQSKSFNKSTLCANTLLYPVKGSWDTYPQIILSIHTRLHNFFLPQVESFTQNFARNAKISKVFYLINL